MEIQRPGTAEAMAEALAAAASSGKRIRAGGAFTKDRMAGPVGEADVALSTAALVRVLQYEPRDLTISVEAGMPWRELTRLLAANAQMAPLDPPFFESATVGGVVAANTSGPRRRLYGSVRDMVIGMKFATLEGKLVQSGGMVVKNVAGLDMSKLLIGSLGTLAVITSVNFKLAPAPPQTRSFIARFATLEDALAARDAILRGVLQPSAIDLANPAAAARLGLDGWRLLLQAGGNAAVMERYARELGGADVLDAAEADALWARVREFTPAFLSDHPDGAVARLSCTLQGLGAAMRSAGGPALARAGTGIVYAYYADARQAAPGSVKGVIEYAPEAQKRALDLWPSPGSDFEMMERIKRMFDPERLLNRGRMYGRI